MDTGLIARKLEALTAFELDPARLAGAVEELLGQRTRYASAAATGPGERALGPWQETDGFQLGPPRRQTVRLTLDGQARNFVVEFGQTGPRMVGRAAVGQAPVARPAGAEAATRVFALPDLVQVEVSWPAFDPTAIEDGASGSVVRAPINGKVARVFVTEGEAVEKGQRIAVVEAMKMEHVLHAARAGTIAKVAATEGQQVTQGTLIASLGEPAG